MEDCRAGCRQRCENRFISSLPSLKKKHEHQHTGHLCCFELNAMAEYKLQRLFYSANLWLSHRDGLRQTRQPPRAQPQLDQSSLSLWEIPKALPPTGKGSTESAEAMMKPAPKPAKRTARKHKH